MPILVSDTSVLIDLERAHLSDEMFLLPFDFAVPDVLFERELLGRSGERLTALGLRVEVLTSDEVRRATIVNRENARLSVPDAFAFAVAEVRGWGLLTGDRLLRELATNAQVEMHGVLWLLDQLADGNHVEFDRLHAGLADLSNHPRCRLPTAEVQHRLARFSRFE